MGVTTEIFLTKKYVEKQDWQSLIEAISDFVGFWRKWYLIVVVDNNKIRYFIKSRIIFPTSINNLGSFLLKQVDNIELIDANIYLPIINKIGVNLFQLIDYLKVKKNVNLQSVIMSFKKIGGDKIISKTKILFKKDNKLFNSFMPFCTPICLLNIDYGNNKRFTYQSVPKYLDITKSINLLASNNTSAIFNVDTFPYLQGSYYLNQQSFDFDKHSIIIGASGSGKSKFISLFIHNIYKNNELKYKYKIVVIDPHASLENDIGGIGKCIDFKNLNDSIDLFINKNDDVVSSTEILLDLFKSLMSDQYNTKLERVLRHSLYLLLFAKNFNFNNLKNLILEVEYRNTIINTLKSVLPDSITNFFLTDFNELKTKSYGEAISPIISFIDEMELLPVFNTVSIKDNLESVIKNNFLTIFSLDRIKLGDKTIKTIAGLLMQQMLTLIQKYSFDEHIIFIIDEVALVENPILGRFLSEARKYNLSLILAGQYFNQITENLKNAILANVLNYYIFRISRLDACFLVDNFNIKVPVQDTRERKIQLLTELNNRECIFRIGVGNVLYPAMKGKTLDFKSIPRVKKYEDIKVDDVKNMPIKRKFTIDEDISLHDILKENSTSRKVINNE